MNLDAVLKVRADVQGQGEIEGLSRSFGNLNKQAAATGVGLGRMGQAAKGVGGLMGALVPVGAIAGLTAIAGRSIDAADNLYDMSQRTGVAVETLSRFGNAAKDSGTSIEGVAKGMAQLAKRVADTGKSGDAVRATLQGMGIAATDANGKIRPLDDLMLDVADRFSKMPDGAEKSALAMRLFGKSGTELIPMLNEGRSALEKYQATISGDMAKSADKFNDRISELGRRLQTQLLPVLERIVPAITGLLEAFDKLPGPVQNLVLGVSGLVTAFVLLAPAINAVIGLAGILSGIGLGATIAGWLGAIGPALAGIGATIAGWAGAIGPAIAAISAAFSGLLTFLTGTILPGLLAFFSGPAGWITLAVVAIVAAAIAFREPLMKFFEWLWEWGEPIRKFFVDLWNGAVDAVMRAVGKIGDVWKNISDGFIKYVYDPIKTAWDKVTRFIPDAMTKARDAVVNVWKGVINTIKSVINGVLNAISNNINAVINEVNFLISKFNALPGPDIGIIPKVSLPQFAEGGVVGRPTLAMVGEGGEREYIVPESKMARASANFLAGARGDAVLAGAGGGGNAPVINITTGPVMEFNGERYVTMADMERAMRITANGVIGRLRTPSARIALGMA